MSSPGGEAEEPQIEIRRVLEPNSGRNSYQSTASEPVGEHSINSVNAQNGTGSRTDKAPLLQRDLLRSLSGLGPELEAAASGRRDGLSTFSGVYCPVALSMFSVLLFLRMGFVVGQSGILLTLAQLILAYSIVLVTVLSLSAVSTNGAIEGGGVYYMISRALGPEFGGSIGVLFFFANVFANALYVSGFVECLVSNFGPGGYTVDGALADSRWFRFLYGIGVSVAILVICLVGAAMFARTSIAILAVIAISYFSFVLSLIIRHQAEEITLPRQAPELNATADNQTRTALYTGLSARTFAENLYPDFSQDYTTGKTISFALVFGVVFSGVTGIMAGANMSGELKFPNVSIPKGTLEAVLSTLAVYILTTFLLGASCSHQLLQGDYVVMQQINVWSWFIIIGIFATTLFAGLSNLIGASRVLTRMAEDRLFGPLLNFATITVQGNNPIVSVVLSWFLSMLVLVIGALNTIAQVTSIFFLLSYFGVNLACMALDLASAPNFRPTFKLFSWQSALVGAVVCVVMMFVVDPVMSGVAIILLLLLLMGLHYKAPVASWGSISQALIFHQVRKYLLMLDSRKDHVKYWRPQMLLLVNSPRTACPLIDFVNDLKKSGLYVIGHVRTGRLDHFPMDPLHEDNQYWLSLIDHLRVKAFVELTMSDCVRDGVQPLMRLSGLGAMKPNTIILGFPDGPAPENTLEQGRLLKDLKYAKLERAEVVEYFTSRDVGGAGAGESRLTTGEFVGILADALKLLKNVAVARNFHRLDKEMLFHTPGQKFVDVWPVNLLRPHDGRWDNSCLFLLQLGCILHMVPRWKHNTTLRVFLCVSSLQDMERREKQLQQMLNELRISARSLVLPWDHVTCHEEQGVADAADFPSRYVDAMNEMLRRNSADSAVIFLNMPPPPLHPDKYAKYLENLDRMTTDLPPTMLVHGLSSVISTAL